jgi:peptidoglycan/LPS O-acetylase OafA/YrhL
VEPPQLQHKLFGLDHLRAIAILLVFVFHYGIIFPSPEWVSTIGKFGWTGVDLFFVLSGYLISSQLFLKISQGKKISFPEFFTKRFFRIIPAYLVVVAIYFLLPSFREREAPAPLWKYLSFTQNIGLDISKQGTFSHAWSLCIEEQFYLLLPLILMTLVYCKAIKKGYWLLLFLFIAGLATRLYCWQTLVVPFIDDDNFRMHWYKWLYYPTFSRLDGLLTGVSIAALLQFRPKFKAWILQSGNLVLLAGLLIFAIAYFVCGDEQSFGASVFGFTLVDLAYGFVVLGAICNSSILYKFKSKITTTIANLSYALYLTHKIAIHLTQEYFSKLNIEKDSSLMFFICIVTSLLVALLMNKLVEKPFLKLREKILQPKATLNPQPSSL